MKATRFMRQPFYVTGYEVTEENMDAIARWCEGHVIRDTARPFIRVPVERATNVRQTEAYVGTWVTLSRQNDKKSFKVYRPEWLEKDFVRLPDDEIDFSDLAQCCHDSSGSEPQPVVKVVTTMTSPFHAPS